MAMAMAWIEKQKEEKYYDSNRITTPKEFIFNYEKLKKATRAVVFNWRDHSNIIGGRFGIWEMVDWCVGLVEV